MKKYYKKATLYPTGLSLVLALLISIVDNYDYRSEWITAELAVVLTMIPGIVLCLYCSLLNLTIFFNEFEVIRSRFLWSAMSWFLVPFVGVLIFGSTLNFHQGYMAVYFLGVTMPYLAGLLISFRQFMADQKKISELDGSN